MSKYALGLDFGTESARAVLVTCKRATTLATAVELYPDGVIDETLPPQRPGAAPRLGLAEHPSDWLTTPGNPRSPG